VELASKSVFMVFNPHQGSYYDRTEMAQAATNLKEVILDDKFTLEEGQAFMSGLQALARIASGGATRLPE
jgi:hypothetical protein